MQIKVTIILCTAFFMLQACGSKGKMMHSDATMDNNIQVAMVFNNK